MGKILSAIFTLVLVASVPAAKASGPTFPPIDDYPDEGGTKLASFEVEMPECYPCSN